MITIALSKGRIYKETLPLLAAADIVPADDPEKSRKLILDTNHDEVKLVIIRATDVPTYVQFGAADLGVAGKDVRYFESRGEQIELIKLYGSMELGPIVGLSDLIVDVVDTGNTLKANGLKPVDHIADISSRLVVNKASMKMKHEKISHIIDKISSAVS